MPFKKSCSGIQARLLVEHDGEAVATQHRVGLDEGKVIEYRAPWEHAKCLLGGPP